jgi:hypothetical protein
VTEYRDHFLWLTRYAPAEVANDGDKQERFKEGLDDHLENALMNHRFDNFNQLVDAALNTERKCREIEEKKRKMVPAASGSNTQPWYQYPRQQQYPPRPQQHQQAGQGQRLPAPPACSAPPAPPAPRQGVPSSRLQHSHGCVSTVASRDTTPTSVPGRRSLDSRGAQLNPRRHPRAG